MRQEQSTAENEVGRPYEAPRLTAGWRWLIGGVIVPMALVIAGLGFAVSYHSVQQLAATPSWHFGGFSYFVPIIMDAGIVVLLALDVVLTYLRMPFPMLRQGAWLLTFATIAANASAAWPHPVPVLVHALAPGLFIAVVEAARHAIGRMANLKAGKYMESVRLIRWIISPVPTFKLWRRMKLWEIRSYEETVTLESHRLVYRSVLRGVYGRAWRWKAPLEALLPLKLAQYGRPVPVLNAPLDPLLERFRPAGPVAAAPTAVDAPVAEVAPAEPVPALEVAEAMDVAETMEPLQAMPVQTEPVGPVDVTDYTEPEPLPVHLTATELQYPQPVAPAEPVTAGWSPQWSAAPAWTAPQQYAEPFMPQAVALDVQQLAATLPGQRPQPQGPVDVTDYTEPEVGLQFETPEMLSGKAGLVALYPTLTDEQKAMPANKLAELLAPKLGLSDDSCRKYIGAIRKGTLG